MKKEVNVRVAIVLAAIAIIAALFLAVSIVYPQVPNEWKVKYEIPTNDSLWAKASEGDTLYVQWDQPNESDIDRYTFYATIADTSLDSLSWFGNYSEIINNWDVSNDSTWGSILTISLPIGLYMAQLVAIDKAGNQSFPSDPAWLVIEKRIIDYTPKRFRIIVRRKK